MTLVTYVRFVWQGSGSNEEERESATHSAIAVGDLSKNDREMIEFEEGEEPDAFWKAIGAKKKKEYAPYKLLEVWLRRRHHKKSPNFLG